MIIYILFVQALVRMRALHLRCKSKESTVICLKDCHTTYAERVAKFKEVVRYFYEDLNTYKAKVINLEGKQS